jgi:Spy/CpxP family protein refolding chaperone
MNRLSRIVFLSGLLAIVFASKAHALGPYDDEDWAPEQRGHHEQRLKQVRGKVLRNQVGLDERRAKKTEQILDRFAAERRKVFEQRRQARRKLNELVNANSKDEVAYRNALLKLGSAEQGLNRIHEQEKAALAKVLTAKERANLLVSVRKTLRQGPPDHARGKGKGRVHGKKGRGHGARRQ